MPVYEFYCRPCKHREEWVFSMEGVPAVVKCPMCGGEADRVYHAPAIQFKGKGFYTTDYKRKKEHGAKEDKPPQEVKKDADKAKETKSDPA